MSRNSSVAVLADCTDLYNSHVSLIGLNGPSSVLSIENETILSNNTDISPSQVVSSVSFQERVRSTDLAALFPRGSLNQKLNKIKKKKKSSEISLSASQSSENISSLQSNANVTLSDNNVSGSFEEYSENKEESSKPFNKHLYLKKKSVNVSFDSGSLNNSISEKSLKRKSRAINVSLDQLNSKRRDDMETIKNDSLEIGDKSAKVFNKRSYLKKKSVNFSFDSGSLNNSQADKSIEDSRINNVSLQSKRKNALRSRKFDSVLNIDNLKSGESSEEKSTPKKTKSNPKRTNISCSGLTSAEGNILDENTSNHDKTIDSLKAINEDSAKVLKKKNRKKKSINISFDSSCVNDSRMEKSELADVSLDKLSSNVTESAEIASDPFEGSKKMEIEKGPSKIFNKNLYLKKKSINLSFDSSSLNASTVEKTLDRKGSVADVSLNSISSKIASVTESAECAFAEGGSPIFEGSPKMETAEGPSKIFNKNLYLKKKSIKLSFDSSSLNSSTVEKTLERESEVAIVSLDPLASETANATESDKQNSTDTNILQNSNSNGTNDYSNNGSVHGINIVMNGNSSEVENNEEKYYSATKNDKVSNLLIIENLKAAVDPEDETVNDINISKSSEVCVAASTQEEKMKSAIESNMQTNISTNDSLKAIDNESAQIFNKNLYLKKKSINLSFDSSSLNASTVEKTLDRKGSVADVSLNSISSKIASVTESAECAFAEGGSPIFEGSPKMEIEKGPSKIFNKNLYLKKKSIKLSFDSSSLNSSTVEKTLERESEVAIVSLDPLASETANATESDKQNSTDANILQNSNSNGTNDYSNNESVHGINIVMNGNSSEVENNEEKYYSATKNDKVLNLLIIENLKAAVDPEDETVNDINISKSSEVCVAASTQEEKMKSAIESNMQTNISTNDSLKAIDNESALIFNKNLYLKKKSINLSFDSSSLNASTVEKTLDRKGSVADVSLNSISSKIASVTESAECAFAEGGSPIFEGSPKMEIEKGPSKIFNKNLYLKKKSIKLSFDSSSLNSSTVEKTLERESEVAIVSLDPLASETAKATESDKQNSTDTNILQNSNSNGTNDYSNNGSVHGINIVMNGNSSEVENNEEKYYSATKNDKVLNLLIIENLKAAVDPEDETVNDINISKSSEVCVAASTQEEKMKSAIESNMQTNISSDDSLKAIDNESAQIFNKNLYLKKKSINLSFDSSSLNASTVEKTLDRKGSVADVSLDPLASETANATESDKQNSTDTNILQNSNSNGTNDYSNNGSVHGINIVMNGNSSEVENNEEKYYSATKNDKVSNLLIIENLKAAVDPEDETVNDINISKSSEVCVAASTQEEKMKSAIESNMQTNISSNDSLKAIDNESPQIFNKNLYLKKKSINLSFDSSSLNASTVEKTLDRKGSVADVSLDPLASETANATESDKQNSTDTNILQNSNSNGTNDYSNNGSIHGINIVINGNSSEVENNEEKYYSPTENDKVSNLLIIENLKAAVDPEDETVNDINISKSSEVCVAASTQEEKMKSAIESNMQTNISTNDSLKAIDNESAQIFNKNLYLKKKSINLSFDSSSLNASTVEKTLERESEVAIVSLDPLASETANATESDKQNSTDTNILQNSNSNGTNDYSNNGSIHGINIVMNGNSSEVENNEEKYYSPTENDKVFNHLIIGNLKASVDPEDDTVNEINICKSSEVCIAASTQEEKMKSIINCNMQANISTNDSLKSIDSESAQIFNKNLYLRKKSINLSFDSSALSDSMVEKSLEKESEVANVSLNPLASEAANATESSKTISKDSEVSQNSDGTYDHSNNENVNVVNVVMNGNSFLVENDKEKYYSATENDKVSNLLIIENLKAAVDPEDETVNDINISKSSEVCVAASTQEEKMKSAIESNMQTNISTNDSLKAIDNESAQIFNKNLYLKKKSINLSFDSSSLNASTVEKTLDRKGSVADVSLNSISSKIASVTESAKCAFAEGGSPIFEGSPKMETEEGSEKTTNNSGLRSAFVSKKNLDMRMSVGLSVICKDNERVTETQTGKNICHSTPLVKYQKNKITRKKHSSPKELNPNSKEFFACPDVPSRNLRDRRVDNKSLNISKRSRKDSGNSSDNLENSAKKNKTSPSGNGTDDFIENISIIPNPKPLTRSRVMYHSTPISKAFSKNKNRTRVSSNINTDDKNLPQEDKMIQVSKSIFGSSTEVTNATVSKKKSIEFVNNNSSTSDNERSNSRTKRKSYSQQSGIKKLPKLDSISESRSYHSNFISTFEEDTSYCTTRKSIKKVAFKSISSEESSNFGYGNSTDDYAYTNRKSVGFRDAISLIEDTIGNSSDGDIREAVNSDFSIVNPNSIGINDTSVTVNESKTRIDRTDLSINYSAEVPEIVLTENETELNEKSEECSLFNKLIEMAEIKKSGRNMPARQNKQSKCKKKLGGSKLVISHTTSSDMPRNEKWVSPNLIKFLNNKLMSDALDHVINTDRIVSVLCSVVSAVRNLQDVDDIDFALLPLKIILLKFGICYNMIEYCTFISRFTPFEFQRKALPLEGYFGSCKRDIKKKLTDPILTETEKMSLFV